MEENSMRSRIPRHAVPVLRALLVFGLLGLPAGACGPNEGASRRAVGTAAGASDLGTGSRSATDSAFAGLIVQLSEPDGFFDTDNLISNERSYLHVIGALASGDVTGGAFIGVGPDQSFSYIAAIRPEVAYIIDIRRDNLLQHLWFKALFELSPTRVEFLSAMFGRAAPEQPSEWTAASPDELTDWIDGRPFDREVESRIWVRVLDVVEGQGVPLDEDERATIGRIYHQFAQVGLDLTFTSHFRGPRPGYPTYRDLLTERDFQGRQASYLATEEGYRFLRGMQMENRVIPVVGDLAGPHALRAIGEDARERGLTVSAFYTSNVEFYLMRDQTFGAFASNLATLPTDGRSVIIRSLFNRFETLPQTRPGYSSTQLLQPIQGFLEVWSNEGFAGYWDLITRQSVPLD